MAIRKGLGKGRGKGYRNIIGKDPRVHSDSARGIKSIQKNAKRLINRLNMLDANYLVNKLRRNEYIAQRNKLRMEKDELIDKAKQLQKKGLITPKIKITKIEIRRGEGSYVEDPNLGKWQTFENVFDADARLREIGKTAPATGGYDKTDVKVTFADGNTYEGRWDVKHPSQVNADLSIQKHIKQHFDYHAGNTARGEEAIKKGWTRPDEKKEAEDWLKTYDLEGIGD